MTGLLTKIIDFFYPPFRRVMPLQTFRYAACGGLNMVLGWVLFGIFERFIIAGRYFDFCFVVVAPHTASLYAIVPFTFTAGFLMNRNIAFTGSPLRTRTQLVRYLISWLGSLLLDHLLLKFFVEVAGIPALPAQIAATILIVGYSYFMQKYFTFRSARS